MGNNKKSPAEFIAQALEKHDEVEAVNVVAEHRVRVKSKKCKEEFDVAVTSVDTLDEATLMSLIQGSTKPAFVVNIPTNGRFTGTALTLAHAESVAIGGVGDLYRAVNQEEPNKYDCKNTAFRDRGLRQHSTVSGFTKEFDRCYVVHRHGLPDLRVVFIHEYELTADHVRTAVDRYGRFDVLVNSDPNARASEKADDTAAQLGFPILQWGPFYKRLREK